MTSEDLLIIRNDLKIYFYTYDGVAKAVDGINFSVRRGESFGLVGETGCGKSVTAMSIMGLVDYPGKVVSGEILFQGENILTKSEKALQKIRGKSISMVFQDPMSCLDPVFTVGDQLVESICIHEKTSKKVARRHATKMIEEVQIPDPENIMDRYPHELSGGMQQRIVIAMALAHHPQLILADEPTTALDVTIQAQILRLIRDLKAKFTASMILISHNLGIVHKSCDRIGILYAGNLVEVCRRDDFFSGPFHPYSMGLLSAIPKLREERDKLFVIKGRIPDIKDLPLGCTFRPRCESVFGRCEKDKPPLREVKPGHWVACHLCD